jgi:K+-transporting ATPase KdpF subunit
MDLIYLISLILTVLLVIYLIAALFFPERFT